MLIMLAFSFKFQTWQLTKSMSFYRAVLVKRHIVVSSAPEVDFPVGQPTKDTLLEQQKEYRMAALKAKQAGDIDQAKMHIKASKVKIYSIYSYVFVA